MQLICPSQTKTQIIYLKLSMIQKLVHIQLYCIAQQKLQILDNRMYVARGCNTNINTTIYLVRRLQIERRRITMSGTLKNDKTGTV